MAAFASCIGNHLKMELVSDMKNSSFSFMVDPSNDIDLYKMFPMTVRIFDVNFNYIITNFFNLNLMVVHEASCSSCEQSIKNHNATEKSGKDFVNITKFGSDHCADLY